MASILDEIPSRASRLTDDSRDEHRAALRELLALLAKSQQLGLLALACARWGCNQTARPGDAHCSDDCGKAFL